MLEIDLAGIYETHADAETRRFTWIDNLLTADEILNWIIAERENTSGLHIFTILDKSNAQFLGLCGLRLRTDLDSRVDIAYRIHPTNRLKGIATETARAVLEWGFEHKNLDQILAQVHTENLISQKVLEKLHFSQIEKEGIWWLYQIRK